MHKVEVITNESGDWCIPMISFGPIPIRIAKLPPAPAWLITKWWRPRFHMIVTSVSKRSPCVTWFGWVIGWVRT